MRDKFKPLIDGSIVVVVITAVFVYFYWHCIKNGLPLAYEGDAFQSLIGVKGNETGENNPLSLRMYHQLNAPFVGSWCDYPFEKVLSWVAGLLSRCLGLAEGTTFAVLLLQVLAGLSFYGCGRAMGFQRTMLVSGAVLFGLAPYAFLQNLQHLTLTAYWHLPLLILTLLWFGWPERVNLIHREGFVLGCITAFIAGNLNPYYLGPFLVLLSLLCLGVFPEKKWKKLAEYVAISLSAVVGFLIQNMDTLLYAAKHGTNHEAVSRDLWWMVKFGLYLPDLFFPRAHQDSLVSKVSWTMYQSHVPHLLWGESQTAYIGMVSAVSMGVMIVASVMYISSKKYGKISPFFWLTSATLLFSLAGGVNYLLGSFGFLLLRATNRASILLSCMALYFMCEQAPRSFSKRWFKLVMAIIVGIGIWDQLPRYPVWEEAIRQRAWADYKRDKIFFAELETSLPRKAMIFELPVKDYPEMGTIGEMGDYEHFRPVIHSKELRVSYGTVKGRGDTSWQKEIANQNPSAMIATLEKYGFAAILVNKKAYEDHAELYRKQLCNAGATQLMENQDFIIFKINPSPNPALPMVTISKNR